MSKVPQIGAITNYAFPTKRMNTSSPFQYQEQNAQYIQRSIAPVQIARLKQDINSWRDAIREAELAYYPWRVKMQGIFNDTILNGHVAACLQRRKNLTLLKDFAFYDGETENTEGAEVLRKQWFYNLINDILDAPHFGYSLISLGKMVDFEFPEIFSPRRANISPDRQVLSTYVYSIDGIQFMVPEETAANGLAYYDWTIYVPTPSDVGTSICGYGMLYKVAMYEIMLRNIIGWNANYIEVYGQPYRVGKTPKLDGPEADAFFNSLRDMGSNAFAMIGDQEEIEFVESKNAGSGWKSYENMEQRCEKKISKIILGHADALDSTPGKIGATQSKNAPSPVQKALDEIETSDGRFVEHVINTVVIPKLIKLGLKIPLGQKWRFKNDAEKEEIRQKESDDRTKIAQYVYNLSQAGLEVDETEMSKLLGIKVTRKEIEPPAPVPTPFEKEKNPAITDRMRNKLKRTYNDGKR